MNGTIYRLFKSKGIEQEIYKETFNTYEEAYDKMNELYNTEDKPMRWGIQRVTCSEYQGNINTMIQPVWS